MLVYSDTTQLNSTPSCRHVHSVNNCHRSVLNVVTQLTHFVGHDVIYDVFWRVCRETEFWSEEFEEKLIELWEKHACLYDTSTKAFSDRDLLRADWLYAATGSVALPIVGDS